jgi:hypothetical protein
MQKQFIVPLLVPLENGIVEQFRWQPGSELFQKNVSSQLHEDTS